MRFYEDSAITPLGEAVILVDEAGVLRALDWSDYRERMLRLLRQQYAGLVTLERRSNAGGVMAPVLDYFGGDLTAIEQVAVETGGTDFQRAVWAELRRVPCGQTVSYRELAQRIGKPEACRAVGAANGANPVGIVVPCHRVVGRDGSMTGYAGGLERKQWLLRHERAVAQAR